MAMMATDATESNFYKLVAFLAEVAPEVAKEFLKRNVLLGDSFESYLQKNHHTLFHLFWIKACCQCQADATFHRCLSKDQFELLFDFNGRLQHHSKTKMCICKYTPKSNISLDILDISITYCILKNCEILQPKADMWFSTIKEVRNKVVHSPHSKSISNDDFTNYWQKLEGSVLGLALIIDQQYKDTVKAKIDYVKERVLLSADVLKMTQLLHEWLKDKCCEMEKTFQEQHEELTSGIEKLQCKIDSLSDQMNKSTTADTGTFIGRADTKPSVNNGLFEVSDLEHQSHDENKLENCSKDNEVFQVETKLNVDNGSSEVSDLEQQSHDENNQLENSCEDEEVIQEEADFYSEFCSEIHFTEDESDPQNGDNVEDEFSSRLQIKDDYNAACKEIQRSNPDSTQNNIEEGELCANKEVKVGAFTDSEMCLNHNQRQNRSPQVGARALRNGDINPNATEVRNAERSSKKTKTVVTLVDFEVPENWNETEIEEFFGIMQTFMKSTGSDVTINSFTVKPQRYTM